MIARLFPYERHHGEEAEVGLGLGATLCEHSEQVLDSEDGELDAVDDYSGTYTQGKQHPSNANDPRLQHEQTLPPSLSSFCCHPERKYRHVYPSSIYSSVPT